jgi:hypothetical protein
MKLAADSWEQAVKLLAGSIWLEVKFKEPLGLYREVFPILVYQLRA